MARFSNTPPTDPTPRALPDLPSQAQLPDGFALPVTGAPPEGQDAGGIGGPDGLPLIPVIDRPEAFPDEMPDEATAGLMHAPWT